MVVEGTLEGYDWTQSDPHTTSYLYGPLHDLMSRYAVRPRLRDFMNPVRVLDLGCGNGALACALLNWGYQPVGVDPSDRGIEAARRRGLSIPFYQASADTVQLGNLQLRSFDVVVSTEVVEHVYSPRQWSTAAFEALRPGGILICSTPYHGYLKNLALALSGRMDAHFTALWEGGHIKFWSHSTLTSLLKMSGFEVLAFRGAGRIPLLWKSMLVVAQKPAASPL